MSEDECGTCLAERGAVPLWEDEARTEERRVAPVEDLSSAASGRRDPCSAAEIVSRPHSPQPSEATRPSPIRIENSAKPGRRDDSDSTPAGSIPRVGMRLPGQYGDRAMLI